MSYIEIENIDFYNDINYRKEFIENNIDESNKDSYHIDKLIQRDNKLILNNYQKFITNFINPNTKYDKLLLVHSTGVGKTITSLMTAMNFIDIYKKEKKINITSNIQIGSIYILGFTKNIFKKELLTRPEFGIVSKKEIYELGELKKQIIKYNLDKDINSLKELKIRYAQRLRSRKGNGYFEFIGYKELVNRLIIKTDVNYKLQISNIKDENDLQVYLDKNILKLNYQFLESFDRSLLICDEIHNVYNSLETNNWGMCLKLIFNYFDKKNTIRVLFLSATPINNKPIEIVSLIHLLNNNSKVNKKQIFDNNDKITKDGYSIIKKSIIGKISYLKDMNLALYPSMEILGDKIRGIDYLKFIKCPMSDLHFKTYENESKEYIKIKKIDIDENIIDDDEGEEIDIYEIKNIISGLKKYPINLELNNRYLNDFVIPNPENDKLGLFTKLDIVKYIQGADKKWKDNNEIDIIKSDKLLKNTLTGDFLLYDNIKKYSTKYFNMLNIIKNCITNNKGKIFIYHNFVQVSGINFIGEIFKVNGFLELNSLPIKHSRCGICYDFKYKHDKIKSHQFIPIRFITVSSLFSKNAIEKYVEQFNMSNNTNGDEIKIILGSQAIKESYDIKAIQNLIVLHQPVNISTLIQIFGRAIRKNSHIELPVENKKVSIYILVSTIPEYIQKKSKEYLYSYEEMKYKYKVNVYKVIQDITNIFIENAIDLNINYNINFGQELKSTSEIYHIKNIEKSKLLKIDYSKINTNTFQSYYYEDEINMCKYIIKRLFIEYSNIWTYEDLLDVVRNPYFKINFNSELISEYSYILALDFLVYMKTNINILNKEDIINTSIIDNLFNPDEKFIYDTNNNLNIIVYINKYYLLIPYIKEKNALNFYDNINVDLDILYRNNIYTAKKEIDLNDYINNTNINNFTIIKKYFINKYYNVQIDNLFEIITEYDYDFHLQLIEEIVEYFFNLYTDINYQKDINHDFYLKVLYFYNKFNIIIFANKLDNDLVDIYGKYIISTKNLTFTVSDDNYTNYNYNNLVSSLEDEYSMINQDKNVNLQFSYYNKAINESNNYLNTKTKNIKIFDYLLPIGHIFGKEFRFYNPAKYWFTKLNYNVIKMKFVDNNIIIGYLEKTNVGFDIVFKLKFPNIGKIKDQRQIQTGLNCLNMDKPDLYKICKLLNIDISKIKNRKTNICNLIKFTLIKKELEERKKKSNVRYFYWYWEK